ncbi:hypothetical protein [uncultured Tolumonas sp.]|uniref:hypothetical protein n=1 Tax=uncultured Tolumonas sp. TaxID=263765 RepID=UPI002A0A8D76|nr:hypothetical protein [uncultured Tolumonas sp.]
MYWDQKRNKRLISFLYNSNFFTGANLNENLEFVFSTPNTLDPFYIDQRINSARLSEMSNTLDGIINNSISAMMNRYPAKITGPLEDVINRTLNAQINISPTNADITKKLIMELECYFHKNTLNDNEFNWISIDNQRLVDFVWTSLKISTFKSSKSDIEISFDLDNGITNKQSEFYKTHRKNHPYKEMRLEENITDLKSKTESIKLFFDSWGEPLNIQKSLMSSIKEKWDSIKNRTEIIDWLNRNEELTMWSWSYIADNLLNKKIPEWVDISSADQKENERKAKATIITLYDLLDRESEKKLLKSQLSKNGAQQKYREKEKNNTKALNICISIETKEKLNKLKITKKCSIKEIIETLIDDEFERQGC